MSTFSQMAEDWLRENLTTANSPEVETQPAPAARAPEHDPAARKLTKPTSVSFVGPIPGESSNLATQQPDDLDELRAPFVQWVDSRCVIRQRWFSNINPMLLDFAETEIAAGRVPASRDEFVRLLTELAFLVAKVQGETLVSGLALRQDAEEYESTEYKHQSE